MKERDARLLPRLLEALGTSESDVEIVQMVRQVRRIAGSQAFTGNAGGVRVQHDDREVSIRLHTLASILRHLRIEGEAANNERLDRFAAAVGSGILLAAEDLAFGLACLAQVIVQLREQVRAQQAHVQHFNFVVAQPSGNAQTTTPWTGAPFSQTSIWHGAGAFDLRQRSTDLADKLDRTRK